MRIKIGARKDWRKHQYEMRILRAKHPLIYKTKRMRRYHDVPDESHGDQFEMWVMQRAFDTNDSPSVLIKPPDEPENLMKLDVDAITQLIDISKGYFDNSLLHEENYIMGPSVQAEIYEIPSRDDFITIKSEVDQLIELLKNFKSTNSFEVIKYLKSLKEAIYLTVKEKLGVMYARGNFTTTYSFLFFTRLWGQLEDHYYYTYHDVHKNSLLIPFASILCRYDQIVTLYNNLAEGKAQSYLVWILVDFEVNSTMYDMKLPSNIRISTEFQNLCFKKAVALQVELICRQFKPRPAIIPIEIKRLIRNFVIYKNNPKYICTFDD